MERYFEFKFYTEVIGSVIGGVILVGLITFPFIWEMFRRIKKWWKGE